MPTLTKLEKILIDHIAGVDAGANLCDGWLVMKARASAPDRDEVIKQAVNLCNEAELRAWLEFRKARQAENGRFVAAGHPRADPVAGLFRSANANAYRRIW